MDKQAHREWWELHLRVAKGEALNAEQKLAYGAGRTNLNAGEPSPESLVRLRETRDEIRRLESERERLEEKRRVLRQRVTALESALSDKTREVLGVGD